MHLLNMQGDVISWEGSNWIHSEVVQEEQTLESLCKIPPEAYKFMLLRETNYKEMKPLCDIVQGTLPTPENTGEVNSLMQEMLAATKGVLPNELCHDPNRPFTMVVGVKYQRNKETWINVYTNNTHPLVPKGLHIYSEAECAVSVQSGLEVSECDWHFGCGVCMLKYKSFFHLKGMCKANIDEVKWYDFYYYVFGLYNKKPHFR